MSETFVLIHGAFHGGWCWQKVASGLRKMGHDVFNPTMTGFGERAHLLNAELNLNTLIQDVVAVIENEELSDVVLVGHSFGCLPTLGVTDCIPDRIKRVVLLDGMVVEPWGRAADMVGSEIMAQRIADARRHHRGLAFSPPKPSIFGVSDPQDVAWLERRMTPQPLRPYQEPLALQGPLGNGLPLTYVICTEPKLPASEPTHEMARKAGFEIREFAAPHDCMITDPEGTIAEIVRQGK